MKAYQLQRSAAAAQRALQNLRTQITALQDSLRRTPSVSKAVNDMAKSVSDQVDDVQRKIVPAAGPPGSAGPPLPGTPRPVLQRIGQLFNGLESYTAAPTADQIAKLADLSTELKSLVEQINRIIDEAVPNLNKQIRDSGVSFVNPGPRVPSPQ
jgi:ABC-type transporter Mla subunit MlaD